MLQDKSMKLSHLTLAVCYYPEHWDEGIWRNDLERMREHGIEVVRVFEFAWSCVEKHEGVFDFSLFDRFLTLCDEMKMSVIMCTPTATPPAWLTEKYPEVLNADAKGHLFRHGLRRHYNYNSSKYQELSEIIVSKLAERYGQHPAVIGWQIDNEINCEINEFYSESDHAAFRVYLKDNFKSLDKLNEAIGANFWNQGYTAWEEVHLRRNTLHGYTNPHMALLEKRFFSKSARRFVKLQADILHKYCGDRFVTTNGIFGHLDSHEMTQESLEFITFDSYPNFAYSVERGINDSGRDNSPLKDRAWAMLLSRARSISPNFGIMEQQSGANGWDFRMQMPMPKPGQIRLWTMQSVAHGADFISYFRWRTCGYGTEIYWHGLNDYSNQPNRRLTELKQIHSDFKKLDYVAGSRYQAKVGLLCDYLNEWDGEQDAWHGPMDQRSREGIFLAAQQSQTPLDLVYIRHTDSHSTTLKELKNYAMLFYPHPTILTEKTAELLKAYVEQGGQLVIGARSGYKDEYGRCPMVPMPGYAAPIFGVEVEDYTVARVGEALPKVAFLERELKLEAPDFHDILKPHEGTEVMANYEGSYFSGKPALTRKNYAGGGAAWYLGCGFSVELSRQLMKIVGQLSPLAEEIVCPEGVELAIREKNGQRSIFLLNYQDEPQKVKLLKSFRNLLQETIAEKELVLAPYDVVVLSE